ncbi:hypothetical protein PAEPH01_1638, partial [Pancytospora epiphaga]
YCINMSCFPCGGNPSELNEQSSVQKTEQNILLENNEENDWLDDAKFKILCDTCKKVMRACLMAKHPLPVNTNTDYIIAGVHPACVVCKQINSSDIYHLCRKCFTFTRTIRKRCLICIKDTAPENDEHK